MVAQVPELCVYPGEVNPRVRWEGMTPRPVEKSDLAKVRSLAASEFATLVKEVKSHLKSPLAEKNPVFALNFKQIGQIENQYVVEDARASDWS